MQRALFCTAGIAGFLAVALGAFGAHALSGSLSPRNLTAYQTGVQYHLAHAVALFACAAAAERLPGALPIACLFVAGIVLFSGSLYALAITDVRALGMVTPIGGLCFLAGWALVLRAPVG